MYFSGLTFSWESFSTFSFRASCRRFIEKLWDCCVTRLCPTITIHSFSCCSRVGFTGFRCIYDVYKYFAHFLLLVAFHHRSLFLKVFRISAAAEHADDFRCRDDSFFVFLPSPQTAASFVFSRHADCCRAQEVSADHKVSTRKSYTPLTITYPLVKSLTHHKPSLPMCVCVCSCFYFIRLGQRVFHRRRGLFYYLFVVSLVTRLQSVLGKKILQGEGVSHPSVVVVTFFSCCRQCC